MKKRRILMSGLAGFLMFTFLTFSGAAVWAGDYQLPKTIYWGSRYVGGSLYAVATTISEAIAPAMGVKIRHIPGNDVEMLNMLRAGRVQLATFAADTYWASMGLAHYATFAIGPQPLRLIWAGWPDPGGSTGLATQKSGIKDPCDLKGKTLVRVVGAAWSDMGLQAQLAFCNYTYDDVTVIEVSSTGAEYKALAEGKGDYCTGAIAAPGTYEIEASPYGFQPVVFPHENTEGWKRMREIVPYYLPGISTKGPGFKPGDKYETIAYPYPITNTLASIPDELVYAICKAIHQKMDEIVKAYVQNESMLPERAIRPESTVMAPYHNGAIKYFKEQGWWTEKHEEANNKRLDLEKRVQARWEKFVEEAQEQMAKTGKKIKPEEEWPEIVKNDVGLLPQ
jgi:TRAP transporter TAXI family solute receptor